MNKVVEEIKGSLEYLSLVGQKIRLSGKKTYEQMQIISRFWGNSKFRKVDLLWLSKALFKNPYRISRKFQEEGVEGDYTYGETPLLTMDKIVRKCGIVSEDKVYELGSGRGRVAFWLGTYVGCQVVGIENVPGLYSLASEVLEASGLDNVKFLEGDYLEADLEPASVVYLFGTTLGDEGIMRLTELLKQCKSGTKVITVSYPLPGERFEVMKVFEGEFLFGKASVFYHMIS